MNARPKIEGKDTPTGDKASWLHNPYTLEARTFYMKERNQAVQNLINASAASSDINVVRHYEMLMAIAEICNLLTYNEQNRDDDD
jgi:hypothetical protein